jgi:DedD protein
MPWPFSRSEPKEAGEEPAEAGGRPAEARDPEAELRSQTRRRLIGAALLLLAAVIVLPMLLDSAPRPVPEEIAITVVSPPPAARAQADKPPAVDEKMAEPAPLRSGPPPAASEAAPAETPAKAAKPAESTEPAEPAEPAKVAEPTKPAQPPETLPPVQAAAAAAPAAGKFVVQVAAMSTPAGADELAARLVKSGFTAYVEGVTTAEGTLHRVRVGPFASRADAQRAVGKLKAAGHKATLVGG